MRRAFVAGVASMSVGVSLALAASVSPAGSQAQSAKAGSKAAAISAGQDVFQQKCMQCHSVIEDQTMIGPSLYRETKKQHGKNDAEIRAILQDGKGKMPSFKDRLTPEETNNLLAYLHTL